MKVILTLAGLMLASTGFAAGYGDAGCGLGSVVFGGKKGFVQIFAATTNGTSGNQTFGITTGTLNCGGLARQADAFIEANKVPFQQDAAAGQGETILSLSEIYGCKDAGAFGNQLKQDYGRVFSDLDTRNIRSRITALVQLHSLDCQVTG